MTTPELLPNHRRFGLGIAALIVGLDQLIKWIVTGPLQLERVRNIEILPFFDLTWVQNFGVSFGMLSADSDGQRWLLVAFTAVVAGGVGFWMWREQAKGEVLALAMVLGGAIGNIIDRARVGYVIDYADLHIGEFRPFLVFNVADACITIGVLLLVARALLVREKKA
ncbi:MAG: signal peptidase II [Sphingopyxis sp.]|nr:signal peptidase II [Sphingopyxis sp.]